MKDYDFYLYLNDYKKIAEQCVGLEITRDLIKCYQEITVLENRSSRNHGHNLRLYQKRGQGHRIVSETWSGT